MTPTETTCPQCGRALSDESRFCSFCGHRLWGEVSGPVARTEGYAVASVACGVAGLFAAPILGPVLAIVFGNRARDRLARDPALEGAGLAGAKSDAGDNFSTPPCPVENPWPGVRMEGCD